MLHGKNTVVVFILLIIFSAVANAAERYPLLQKLINILDTEPITCFPSKVICIEPELTIRDYQNRLYLSTESFNDSVGISLSAETSHSRMFNYGTYYGVYPQVKRIENEKIAAAGGVYWYADQQGLYMVTQQSCVGDSKTMYRIVRPLKDGQFQWSNLGPHPRPKISPTATSIDVLNHDLLINSIQKDNINLLGYSGWIGDIENGGFCYAIGKGNLDLRLEDTNDFDITIFIVKNINANLVIDKGRRINFSDLEEMFGKEFGFKPLSIRMMAEPTVVMATNTIYVGVRYEYVSESETVAVQEIIRLAPNKKAEFADYQIEYRNSQNSVLNADYCRDESGRFTMQPTKVRKRPDIKFVVTDNDMFCTMNGGRLWLIDMR